MNIKKCKYCNKEFDISLEKKGFMANHTRWCEENPKLEKYRKDLCARNKSLKNTFKHKNQYIKAKENGIKIVCSDATKEKIRKSNTGKKHTEETKMLIREKALQSNHQRVCKKTVEYKCIDGSIVKLDSSWEVELAKILDKYNIKWVRPKPLKWFDKDGICHNYFPDFYLVDFRIYLDPKNDYVKLKQKEKLKCLEEQYNNIFIMSKDDININFIRMAIVQGEQLNLISLDR